MSVAAGCGKHVLNARPPMRWSGSVPAFFMRIIMTTDHEIHSMKRFEELFAELKKKVAAGDPDSGTVKELHAGKHAIGKKSAKKVRQTKRNNNCICYGSCPEKHSKQYITH